MDELVRMSGQNVQRLGGARFLQEFATRGGELRDQANASFGGMGQIMLPMMLARSIQQQVPGMSFGAALRMTGMNEQQARAFEVMQQDPRFRDNMMQQFRVEVREQRRERAIAQTQLEEYNRTPEFARKLGRRWERGKASLSNQLTELGISLFGEDSDIAEGVGDGTGGLLRSTRADTLGSDVQRAHLRDRMRRGTSLQSLLNEADPIQQGADRRIQAERDAATAQARMSGVSGILARQFMGPNGFGFTEAGRGGMTQRDVVESNRGLVNRAATTLSQFFGTDRTSSAQINREASMLERTGSAIERAGSTTGAAAIRQGKSTRSLGEGLGVNADVMDNALGAASAAINKYAGEQTGPFGLDTGQVTEQGILSSVRSALMKEGVSAENADKMLEGGLQSDVVQTALRSGAGSRGTGAQEALQRALNAGGQSGEVRRQERVKATREETTRTRQGALRGLGMDIDSVFGGASKESQKRVLNLLGGEGEDAEIRRLLLAKKAAEAGDSEEDHKAVQRIERELQKYDPEKVAELESTVAGQLSGVDKEDLAGIGATFRGKTGEEIVSSLGKAGADVNKAAAGDLARGLGSVLGDEANAELKRGGMEGLKRYLKAGGKSNLSAAQREKVIKGQMSESQLGNLALSRAGAGSEAAGALGIASEAEDAAMQEMEDATGSIAEGGGPGASNAAFGSAVSEFSEASKLLKEASEEFKGAKELFGLASATGSAGGTGSWWNNIFGGD
jgi:hypothetical protein